MPRAKTARTESPESKTTTATAQPTPATEVRTAPVAQPTAPQAKEVNTHAGNGGARSSAAVAPARAKEPAREAREAQIPQSEIKANGGMPDLEGEIRVRAYELYEARGRTPGHERDDWSIAEREVIARYNHPTA
jgi:hypothetical protein